MTTLQGLPYVWKIGISIIWDFLDLTIFRLPGLGTFTDMIGGFLAIGLWGPIGITAFWEVLDVTDQIDAEMPTLTLIGLFVGITGKR